MQTQLAKGMIAGVMVVLSLAALAFAVVPGTFSYQGYLKNSDGTPVTAATAIRFTLYSSASGVAPLWTESRSVTPANGTYSVQLGATQPLNLPFDRRYYLGITVGADPEMRPLQQLDSVPYALRAAVADSSGPHGHSGADITGGTVADARLSTNVGLLGTAQTVTGLKTFAPASGSVPFAVGSGKTGVVTNLNAEMLEGKRIADLNGIYPPAILSKTTVQDIATQTWTLTNAGVYIPGSSNPFDMAFDGANIWVPGTVGIKKVRGHDR